MPFLWQLSFPDSSVDKDSTCNAEDPSSIPRSGIYAGERICYPLQYSWASLVAQLVKNSPAMWESWVQSLGWEDPQEKRKATHSSILAWRIPWAVWSMGSQRVRQNWEPFSSPHYGSYCILGTNMLVVCIWLQLESWDHVLVYGEAMNR